MEKSRGSRLSDLIVGKRGISFYLTLLSILFTAAMLIVYTRTGITSFTPVLSGKVLTLLWVCAFLGAALSVLEIKMGKYALYLMLLWMWLEYLFYHASYISNVLVGIDGNSFGAGFLAAAALGLLAWLTALLAAIIQKNEIGSAQKADAENADDGEAGKQ